MSIKYFIFPILFSLYISQNIITSWTYDKVVMYDIQKLNKYLTEKFQTLDIPITINNDTLKIENIKLVQIQTNLYDSLINYNTGLLLLTPNKITLNFNFSYTESKKQYQGDSTLELKISNFKLKVKNNKKLEKVNFAIKMITNKENYSIPGIKDKDFLDLLKEVFYYEFNKNLVLSKIIPEQLEKGLSNYYKEFYKKNKEFKVQTNEFFGKMIFPMKNNKFMYFCEDILGESKTAFCYYSGYTSIYDDPIDKTQIPIKNERFSHNYDDLYNIFINNDMIGTIIEYISKNYFAYNPKYYNNETNIKELSYKFDVDSLQKYFKGLEQFKKEDTFDCEIYIESGNLNQVIFSVKVNIKDEKKNYFIMRITSDIIVDIPINKNVRINLCLKETKTQNIEILSSSIGQKIEILNLEELKKAVEESFDFEHNPICLNDKGISLRDYFSEISKAYIEREGIYLEGKHLYQ